MARGSSVSLIVGAPAGVTAKATSAAFRPAAQDRRLAVAVDRPAPLRRGARRRRAGFPFLDGAIGPSTRVSTTPGSPRTTSVGILEHRQFLRARRLEVDDHRRTAGVRRRIDPGVDAAPGRGSARRRRASRRRRRAARRAPVRPRPPRRRRSSPRRSAGRKGRVRPCAARAGRRGGPRPTARAAPDAPPTGPGPSGRGRWRACRRARSPAGGPPPESRSSRAAMSRAPASAVSTSGASATANPSPNRATPAMRKRARGEEPGAEPGDAEEQDRNRHRADERRPGPLDRAARGPRLRKRRQARRRGAGRLGLRSSFATLPLGLRKPSKPSRTKAEVCRGRSCLRKSAADGRPRSLRP